MYQPWILESFSEDVLACYNVKLEEGLSSSQVLCYAVLIFSDMQQTAADLVDSIVEYCKDPLDHCIHWCLPTYLKQVRLLLRRLHSYYFILGNLADNLGRFCSSAFALD